MSQFQRVAYATLRQYTQLPCPIAITTTTTTTTQQESGLLLVKTVICFLTNFGSLLMMARYDGCVRVVSTVPWPSTHVSSGVRHYQQQ